MTANPSPPGVSSPIIRPFSQGDASNFAALNADPEVMADLGGPLTRGQSDAKLARYLEAYRKTGMSRMAVVGQDGQFLGYCGIMVRELPALGQHLDLGWRLARHAWGKGHATRAARLVLAETFKNPDIGEVFAYTGPDNMRSQAVMRRLNMIRRPDLDFSMDLEGLTQPWQGLVWVANKNTIVV